MMSEARALDPNSVISHDVVRLHEFSLGQEDAGYWTAERMASAKPFDLQVEGEPEPDFDPSLLDMLRTPGSEEQRSEPYSAEKDVEALRTLPPFDTARVTGIGNFPYSAVGKLFARVGGADRCGSAFVVGSQSIVTAGHCIYPDAASQWVERVAFVPRYADGAPGPGGLWNVRSLHVLAGWAAQQPNSRLFDLGGATLDRPVSQATGVIGWLANIPPNLGSLHSVGYPLQWVSPQYPFDGNQMWRCIGRQLPASGVLKMANNMTEGASGGPWLIERNGNIYANGLNSFRLTSEPNALASPYFGAGFVNLMNRLP